MKETETTKPIKKTVKTAAPVKNAAGEKPKVKTVKKEPVVKP